MKKIYAFSILFLIASFGAFAFLFAQDIYYFSISNFLMHVMVIWYFGLLTLSIVSVIIIFRDDNKPCLLNNNLNKNKKTMFFATETISIVCSFVLSNLIRFVLVKTNNEFDFFYNVGVFSFSVSSLLFFVSSYFIEEKFIFNKK